MNSAAATKAGRTWRCTASDNSANKPATVPNVENAPSSTHSNATPNGQRRRHHSETQHTTPNTASRAACSEVIRMEVSSKVTIRMIAPIDKEMANATASTAQSRTVLGATSSG